MANARSRTSFSFISFLCSLLEDSVPIQSQARLV
jgi:hypothetical protein